MQPGTSIAARRRSTARRGRRFRRLRKTRATFFSTVRTGAFRPGGRRREDAVRGDLPASGRAGRPPSNDFLQLRKRHRLRQVMIEACAHPDMAMTATSRICTKRGPCLGVASCYTAQTHRAPAQRTAAVAAPADCRPLGRKSKVIGQAQSSSAWQRGHQDRTRHRPVLQYIPCPSVVSPAFGEPAGGAA